MGRINQALVQDRLFLGVERIPVVLLLTACALGVVLDGSIGVGDVLVAGVVFSFGFWCLRLCADYNPRFFRNGTIKLMTFATFWAARGGTGAGPWMVPATPTFLKRRAGKLSGFKSKSGEHDER